MDAGRIMDELMEAMREALVAADFEYDNQPSKALLLGLHRELNLLEDALEDNDAESAALLTASLLGHENLNTTKRYVQRTADQLQAATENIAF